MTVRMSEETRRVTSAQQARQLAKEALRAEGYDEIDPIDEPHRASGSWIVPMRADSRQIHAHVNAMTQNTRLAVLES